VPIGFDLGLSPLGAVTSSSTVSLTGGVTLDLTFGVDLSALRPDTTPDEPLDNDSLSNHFFIKDASIVGTVGLNAADIDAVASLFDFVNIALENGNGTLGATVAVQLNDPNSQPNTTGIITLPELYKGLASLSTLVTSDFDGFANLTLPVVIQPALPGLILPPGARLTVVWTDIADPATLRIEQSGLDQLFKFDHFTFNDLLAAIQGVIDYLATLEKFGFLNQKLPLLNRSISDLLQATGDLAEKIEAFKQNPAGSLQAIEELLEDAIGLADPLGTPNFNNPEITFSFDQTIADRPALKIQLQFGSDYNSGPLPLNLDLASLAGLAGGPIATLLAGVSNLVDVGGEALVQVQAGARFNLDFGIDLANSSLPTPFLYDSTGLTFDASVLGSNIRFDAAIGPVGVFIGNETHQGTVTLDRDGNPATADRAAFTVNVIDDASDHRYLLSELSTSLVNVTLQGAAKVDLPVFCPTPADALDRLQIDVPDLGYLVSVLLNSNNRIPGQDPVRFTSTPDLAACIANLNISTDLSALLDGLDLILKVLQDALSGEVFGIELPLVGDGLKDGAKFIEDFREDVLAKLRTLSNKTDTAVQQALFEVFGPTGLNLLRDSSDADTIVDLDDIKLVSTIDDVSFEMHLGQSLTLLTLPIDFDIGLPALGLDVNGNVTAKLGWDFLFGFGVSRTAGVYFNTAAKDSAGNLAPELIVDLDVTIPGLSTQGNLLFLQLLAQDDPAAPSRLGGRFTIDLNDPRGDDNRLSFSELANGPNFDDLIDASFTAAADVNLKTEVSFGANAAFPRILADFHLDWAFNNANPGASQTAIGNRPEISFDNIKLDLGTFLTNVVKPVIDAINTVIDPIRPVLDVLDTKLPVLSDITPVRNFLDGNGDGKVTLLDMAARLGGQFETAAIVINAVNTILDIGDLLRASSAGDTVLIDFGSFNLGTVDVRGRSDLSGVSPNITQGADPLAQFKNSGSAAQREAVDKMTTVSGGGFSFPVIDNPASLFGLLMGKDVTLVAYDMAPMDFTFVYEQFFPLIGPLGVTLVGTVDAKMDFAFAFDTFGARQFAKGGYQPGEIALILNGLYISDTKALDGSGDDVPEVTLAAGIEAFGGINAGVASAGVGGGIFATIDFNLHDLDPDGPNGPKKTDGKIRANEFIQLIQVPLRIFDVAGKLTAGLSAFVKLDLGLFSVTKRYKIAEVTLLNFDFDFLPGDLPEPVLAGQSGDVLTLNMGPRAAERHAPNTTDGDEVFTVSHVSGVGGDETVLVTAFGIEQTYAGVRHIVAEGGLGDDTINILEGVLATSELWGDFSDPARAVDFGDDDLFGGEGAAILHGGDGADQLVGRSGADKLFGDAGDDSLQGGAGNDHLDGGSGFDVLDGGEGDDLLLGGEDGDDLTGGAGNDRLEGGDGADQLSGDGGNDVLIGGLDADVITGGEGNDSLIGGNATAQLTDDLTDISDDILVGEGGNDQLDGGKGNDRLDGGDGDDILIGGDGADTLLGGAGNDYLSGSSGADQLFGDQGDDQLFGGTDNDILEGGSGNDTLFGEDATDRLFGGDGNDRLEGGAGDDLLDGGSGTDILLGQSGNDLLLGGAGVDTIDGGSGDDRIEGNEGADLLIGGAGVDSIAGGPDGDTIFGGSENDFISGDAGNDIIAAENGDDRIIGGAGDDQITGGQGNDTIEGGADDDTIFAGDGDDTVNGGTGNDLIFGDSGQDSLFGGDNDDLLVGGVGNDLLSGDAGSDILWGGGELISRSSFRLAPGETLSDKFELPPNFLAEAAQPTIQPPLITAKALAGQSLAGTPNDGLDNLRGGDGDDFLFGGSDPDLLDGGAGDDYADGGAEQDQVFGGSGDDVVRGGAGDDIVHGDEGIDQVYGDSGRDYLFGDAGAPNGTQAGQRLFGGDGIDFLFAFAAVTINAPAYGAEISQIGDELHGGPGGDFLYGNLRKDFLFGDSGKDFLHGDYLSGPLYALNDLPATRGGADQLFGGGGEDELLGGGGNDQLWGGPDSDRLEGQDGSDQLFGGGGIDVLMLDVDAGYSVLGGETFNGHFGNLTQGDSLDDNATDILLIPGTNFPDTIKLSQTLTGLLLVEYTDNQPMRVIEAAWRDAQNRPVIEQFSISTLGGNDAVEFAEGQNSLDLTDLINRSDDWVTVIEGGAGNDILRGTAGRDRMDGGQGSDILFGLGGDDRLFGDDGSSTSESTDHDVIFGGQGHDDLIGGPGTNDLYAWSQDPHASGAHQVGDSHPFGVFVDPAATERSHPNFGKFFADSGDFVGAVDGTGNPIPDGKLDIDPSKPARVLEDTGLNRVLGGLNNDKLYGGTGLDFLYGGDGEDELFRADGTRFENLDGGLLSGSDDDSADWKAYAKETNKVWYYGATNLDDEIHVDFVTEPGLLGDHHLITRLTRNGDAFTFDAQVQLDFQAQDEDGNYVWRPDDLVFDAAKRKNVTLRDLQKLLPPEGDFLAIIIDALAGNDQVIVGPTVIKSVWIDAGPGDDRVEIRSGRPILVDVADSGERNDEPADAFDLGSVGGDHTFQNLTLDSPTDEDWYLITLGQTPQAGDTLTIKSLSEQDQLRIEIRDTADNILLPTQSGNGKIIVPLGGLNLQAGLQYRFHISSNATPTIYDVLFAFTSTADLAGDNSSATTAFELTAIQQISQVTGLRLQSATDEDWFHFTLPEFDANKPELRSTVDRITLVPPTGVTSLTLDLLKPDGTFSSANSNGVLTLASSLPEGEYKLKITGAAGRFDLVIAVGQTRGDILDLSPGGATDFSSALRILRRDVILGGPGNDVLSGGSGEEWIFGGAGNDVLTGGLDRQASDLLFGEGGDDIFQLIPDRLPFIKGTQRTLIPTLSDRFDGGAGDDRVLFLGGDVDRLNRPVPDFVAIRYNTKLHRYEFTSLIWDIANQQFLRDTPNGPFTQAYIYYQAFNIEHTVINTRAGDDEVHGDPEYKFPQTESEWGIAPGDFEQRGLISALEIYGGDGNDRLYGGAYNDIIDGGAGLDFILGGEGDDEIYGGDGDDLLAGQGQNPTSGDLSTVAPDRFEFAVRNGLSGQNDDFRFASLLGPVQGGQVVDELSFHLGDREDWLIIKTPDAIKQFGSSHKAFLSLDMITVSFTVAPTPAFNPTDHIALFAAQDSDPTEGLAIEPVEFFEGVPEYYLLRIENPIPAPEIGNFTPEIFGPQPAAGPYTIHFNDAVGKTIDVPAADEDALTISSINLANQPAVIPLGNFIGDVAPALNVWPDFIAAVRDDVPAQESVVYIYAGRAAPSDFVIDSSTPALKVPGLVLSPTAQRRALFASPGDYNNDGRDDIAVAITRLPGAGSFVEEAVYIMFGRATPWTGELDLVRDADVVISGMTGAASVASAGDVNGDGIDDLVVGEQGGSFASIFYGRADWITQLAPLLSADFTVAGAPSTDGLVIDNTVPVGAPADQVAGLWHVTTRRGGEAGHSASHSLYFGQDTTGNYSVGLTAGKVTTGPISLVGVSGAELTFNYLLLTEASTNFDKAEVQISTDGTNYSTVKSRQNGLLPNRSAWTAAAFNLKDFIGQTIRIRFVFDTVDSAQNDFEGWYIDDVVVRPCF
jgi:Ca2+-binding RTX toxin-like protein